jgi:hypothetical protein
MGIAQKMLYSSKIIWSKKYSLSWTNTATETVTNDVSISTATKKTVSSTNVCSAICYWWVLKLWQSTILQSTKIFTTELCSTYTNNINFNRWWL